MSNYPNEVIQEICDILKLYCITDNERIALFTAVFGRKSSIFSQIVFTGSPEVFTINAVGTLANFGDFSLGKSALITLLEYLENMVGFDVKKEIKRLILKLQKENIRSFIPEMSKVAYDSNFVIEQLYVGNLPSDISIRLGKWLIVEELWSFLKDTYAQHDKLVVMGKPRTVSGVINRLSIVMLQISIQNRNMSTAQLAISGMKICEEFLQFLGTGLRHNDKEAGVFVGQLIKTVYSFFLERGIAERNLTRIKQTTDAYFFNAAEKIRELCEID